MSFLEKMAVSWDSHTDEKIGRYDNTLPGTP